jgi:molybdopterin converting factor small subunit
MRIELLGVPRALAGVAECEFPATTLGDALARLAADYPALAALLPEGRLHPALAANLNGDRFVRDPATPIEDDDALLILSADAGG